MMNKLKFRAWHIDGEEMITEGGYIQVHGSGHYCVFNESEGEWLDKGCIIMQFTGLYDKNRTEIYEGDIVKCHDHPTGIEDTTGEVYFKHGYYQVNGNALHDYGTAWTEVIGNVHQNPHLLTNS